jgi:hypothetical protein
MALRDMFARMMGQRSAGGAPPSFADLLQQESLRGDIAGQSARDRAAMRYNQMQGGPVSTAYRPPAPDPITTEATGAPGLPATAPTPTPRPVPPVQPLVASSPSSVTPPMNVATSPSSLGSFLPVATSPSSVTPPMNVATSPSSLGGPVLSMPDLQLPGLQQNPYEGASFNRTRDIRNEASKEAADRAAIRANRAPVPLIVPGQASGSSPILGSNPPVVGGSRPVLNTLPKKKKSSPFTITRK